MNNECKDKENSDVTHPAYLHQLGDHDDAEAVLLPHHPPEIQHRLLLGPWWREEETASSETNSQWRPLVDAAVV